MNLYQLARELTEEHCGNELAVGRRYWYRAEGKGRRRPIEIISGRFWGTYGLSNHWTWKYLDRKNCHGSDYGGGPPHFVPMGDE